MKKMIPLMLMLALVSPTAYSQGELSVTGNASLAVKPTLTTINLSIDTKSATYPEAVEKMIERVDQLSRELKKTGFKDQDIITSNFHVDRSREFVKNMWKDSGYIARQSLVVTFPQDKKKLLEVLNTVTRSSANPSIRLSFGMDADKKESIQKELIKQAVLDAKGQADIIAAAAGYKIAGIKSIQIGYNNPGPNPMYEARAATSMLKDANIEISNFEASNLKFNESVSIVYLMAE